MLTYASVLPTLNREDVNSLEYLKLCVTTFKKYSSPENKLYIHTDGRGKETPKWLDSQDVEYTQSDWGGYTKAIISLFETVKEDVVICLNDDLVFSPNWDINLILWLKGDVIVKPRLVEPQHEGEDFGRSPKEFDEKTFLEYVKENSVHKSKPWGRTGFVQAIRRDLYFEMGGFDDNFSPYGVADIDFHYRLALKRPEVRGIEAFDSIWYHFSMGPKRKLQAIPELSWEAVYPKLRSYFIEKHGIGTGEAGKRIKEMMRSETR